MNQEDVAQLLGITQTAVSKIENGSRGLSDTEKKLLDWYFFGTIPPRLNPDHDFRGIFEFDPAEWQIITILATREGNKTPGQWIADRIRGFLENSPKAEAVRSELARPFQPIYPSFTSLPEPDLSSKVADETVEYKVTPKIIELPFCGLVAAGQPACSPLLNESVVVVRQ